MTSSHARHEAGSQRRRYDDDEDGDARTRRSRRGERNAEPLSADVNAAKTALDRVSLPQEAIDRISEVVSPGSAVIISDEALSKETGKGTDFVVLMSGEPQGGIKFRRHGPGIEVHYVRPRDHLPYWRWPFGGL